MVALVTLYYWQGLGCLCAPLCILMQTIIISLLGNLMRTVSSGRDSVEFLLILGDCKGDVETEWLKCCIHRDQVGNSNCMGKGK